MVEQEIRLVLTSDLSDYSCEESKLKISTKTYNTEGNIEESLSCIYKIDAEALFSLVKDIIRIKEEKEDGK